MSWLNGEWYENGYVTVTVTEWCPQCAPDGVPEPWTYRLCPLHVPHTEGSADALAKGPSGENYWASGTSEAEGETNAAFCRILHRHSPDV